MDLDPDSLERLIDRILAEDIGAGDITAEAVIPKAARLSAALVAREPLTVAGLGVAAAIFRRLAPDCDITDHCADGDGVAAGAVLARLSGPARGLLGAERAALNMLQHLSGIATLTRRYVEEIAGSGAILLDTRKTIPGLRRLAKYATRMGGAHNHRMGLYDAILIKDNHIAIAGGVGVAVAAARAARGRAVSGRAAGGRPIEVECDSLDQVREAIAAGAGRLLLDNMSPADLRAAVAEVAGRLPVEASGGIRLDNIAAVAATGVDYISVGRLTQSAPAVDIAMDYRPN